MTLSRPRKFLPHPEKTPEFPTHSRCRYTVAVVTEYFQEIGNSTPLVIVIGFDDC